MTLVGKVAYLAVFPGMVFVIVAGALARSVFVFVGTSVSGGERQASARGASLAIASLSSECIATSASLHAVLWLAPVVKLLALSWVACLIFGFFEGDIALLYALLVVASGADVLAAALSDNPRTRQAAGAEAVSLAAWAVPLALVLACLSLRTGTTALSGIISWQGANGVMVAAPAGGALARTGAALALLASLFGAVALARARPLGRSYLASSPGGILDDVSGPPLAFFIAAETAALFVVPLLLVSLFFAGPAARWYEVVFWGLKALGFLLLLAVVDSVFARSRPSRVLFWSVAVAGAMGVAALALTWAAVMP